MEPFGYYLSTHLTRTVSQGLSNVVAVERWIDSADILQRSLVKDDRRVEETLEDLINVQLDLILVKEEKVGDTSGMSKVQTTLRRNSLIY